MTILKRPHQNTPPTGFRPLSGLGAYVFYGAALALSACGGGSNSNVVADPTGTTVAVPTTPAVTPVTPVVTPVTPTVAEATLSGVAASGTPFAGAKLKITDQTGATVCNTQTDAAGFYSCTLPAGTVAPLVISATLDTQAFYSMSASATGGTTNVTPLTTIIASRLATNGDPANLATDILTTPQTVTAATLTAQVNALIAALQPVLTLLGETIDPLTGVFKADGTGQDKVLDALAVTVQPDGSGANIQISLKTTPTSDSTETVAIAFRSSDAAIPVVQVTTTTAVATLPTPAIVADFAARLTACYALPLTQRVNAISNTVSATGTAADVIAPVCRQLFVGNDPATYYSSGAHVGRDANNLGSFAGLFRAGATGVVWDNLNVEFTTTDGDFVMTYRTTDASGNIGTDTLRIRMTNGSLQLTGNNYDYGVTILPQSEDREILNSPAFSYFTTGYNINIANRLDSSGNSIFSKVEVTTPFADPAKLTFVPSAGLSFLPLLVDGAPSGTNILRFAAAFADSSTAGNPSTKESLVYTPIQYTDAQLAAIANQSAWTVEFFFADTGKANVVQKQRTVSRAQTLAEIRQTPIMQFTAATKAALISVSAANASYIFGAPSQATPNTVDIQQSGSDSWVVPAGGTAPTQLSVQGRAPFGSTTANAVGLRFNDGATVASSARNVIVYCGVTSSSDKHCDSSFGFQQYALGTTFNLLELTARTQRQILISKKAALYTLK